MNYLRIVSIALALTLGVGCESTGSTSASPQTIRQTTYNTSGEVVSETVERNGKVVSELRRLFDGTVTSGDGVIRNTNEGLARRSAIALAVADLAGKVQSMVRSNTTIYQNADVRDVVETRVQALVNNYSIVSEGYDPSPNQDRYRVRVQITGEALSSEFARVLD